jgi:TonB family protein
MHHASSGIGAAAALLALQAMPCAAQTPPPPGATLEARVAPFVSLSSRCPDLHVTDDEDAAVVVFMVNVVGTPSKVSLRTSSGSADLDNAAVACVPRMRFQPATHMGDAAAFDSWQQIGLKWARPSQHTGVAVGTSVAAAATAATAVTAPAAPSRAAAAASAPAGGAVELRVCANDKGQLTQDPTIAKSSGNADIDAAAVRIAKAGSGSYRPAAQLNGRALSGCADLSIKFETH